jgi:hypothetical protein
VITARPSSRRASQPRLSESRFDGRTGALLEKRQGFGASLEIRLCFAAQTAHATRCGDGRQRAQPLDGLPRPVAVELVLGQRDPPARLGRLSRGASLQLALAVALRERELAPRVAESAAARLMVSRRRTSVIPVPNAARLSAVSSAAAGAETPRPPRSAEGLKLARSRLPPRPWPSTRHSASNGGVSRNQAGEGRLSIASGRFWADARPSRNRPR